MQALLGIAAVAGFALVFVFVMRFARRQKEALAQALTQAGYHPLPRLEPDVEEVLLRLLHPRRTKRESVKDIYRYSGLDYELYRFDVPGEKSDDTRYAMVFRRPLFPPFGIMPNLKLPGFLDGLVTKLMQNAMIGGGYTEVEVHGRPQFQEKYHLYAKDGHLLLKSVPMQVWERLCALPGNISLQGEGRVLLMLELVPIQKRSSNSPAAELRRMIEQADALHGVFRELQSARVAV